MTKQELLAAIDAAVYENQNGEITGGGLNELLKLIVNNVGGCDCVLDLRNADMTAWSAVMKHNPASKAETCEILGISESQLDALTSGKVVHALIPSPAFYPVVEDVYIEGGYEGDKYPRIDVDFGGGNNVLHVCGSDYWCHSLS